MARYLIFIISFFIFGCETSGQQIVKPEKFNFNEIKFDAVSKDLSYLNPLTTQDEINYGEIIDYWFNNRIKTNGFEGNYSSLDNYSKVVLILTMFLGRLEMLTILILFLPSFWKN